MKKYLKYVFALLLVCLAVGCGGGGGGGGGGLQTPIAVLSGKVNIPSDTNKPNVVSPALRAATINWENYMIRVRENPEVKQVFSGQNQVEQSFTLSLPNPNGSTYHLEVVDTSGKVILMTRLSFLGGNRSGIAVNSQTTAVAILFSLLKEAVSVTPEDVIQQYGDLGLLTDAVEDWLRKSIDKTITKHLEDLFDWTKITSDIKAQVKPHYKNIKTRIQELRSVLEDNSSSIDSRVSRMENYFHPDFKYSDGDNTTRQDLLERTKDRMKRYTINNYSLVLHDLIYESLTQIRTVVSTTLSVTQQPGAEGFASMNSTISEKPMIWKNMGTNGEPNWVIYRGFPYLRDHVQ